MICDISRHRLSLRDTPVLAPVYFGLRPSIRLAGCRRVMWKALAQFIIWGSVQGLDKSRIWGALRAGAAPRSGGRRVFAQQITPQGATAP